MRSAPSSPSSSAAPRPTRLKARSIPARPSSGHDASHSAGASAKWEVFLIASPSPSVRYHGLEGEHDEGASMAASYLDHLKRRREEILARMDAALTASCRSFADVDLIAVSKTAAVEEVAAAIQAGFHRFGENRPQELARKIDGISRLGAGSGAARFDMIGNLQTNKVNTVLAVHRSSIRSAPCTSPRRSPRARSAASRTGRSRVRRTCCSRSTSRGRARNRASLLTRSGAPCPSSANFVEFASAGL